MTVASTSRRAGPFAGNGVTTVFPFTYKVFSSAHLVVLKGTAASVSPPTTLVLGVNYSVSLNADQNVSPGGSVTYPISGTALAAGETLTIVTNQPESQGLDLTNGGGFFPASIEDEFDSLTILIQQHAEKLARAVVVPTTDGISLTDLPGTAARIGKFMAFDANGQPTVSAGSGGGDTSLRADLANGAAGPGNLLVAIKRSYTEIATGMVPQDYTKPVSPGVDLQRFLVPNDVSKRAANSAALKALFDPATAGQIGNFYFTPVIGSDTYYFDAVPILIRDKITLGFCGCTTDFAGAFNAANDTYGFFTFIRDVTLENGAINVNYNGTGGTANGTILRIGGRSGYNFSGQFSGTGEENFATLMGNINVRNMRMTTNNAAGSFGVLALGGLVNVNFDNVVLNGQGTLPYGLWYEFGDWHYDGSIPTYKTAHGTNMRFANMYFKSMKNTVSGAAMQIVGANPCVLENIYVDTCYTAVAFSPGEALFYNVGPPFLLVGNSRTRWHTLINVTAINCASTALGLVGSQAASGGYLSGSGLLDWQLCDLQGFEIINPAVDNSISCNGPFNLHGGVIYNGGVSGGLIIGQDSLWFGVYGTEILNSRNEGIRADTTDSIRGVPRNRRGEIIGAKVCGSNFGGGAAPGIGLGDCDGVLIRLCQLGYSTLYDLANEATQTFGVTAGNTALNVVLDNNFCKPASGNAYNKTSGHGGCTILSARGTKTISGDWLWGGPSISGSITYSASMTPDFFVANEPIVTANNGTAFTINAPLNPFHGQISRFTIRNAAGGALGVATWNAAFKMTAWTQPANGFSRSIEFRYDGANYIEINRSAADVPN